MLTSDILSSVDEMCKKYDRKDYPGISVGIAENEELIFCKGYGMANLAYDIPIDGDTVFHCCSMAKQFTAACIAMLIEEGKLTIDQDIRSIFPQLKHFKNKIRISDLVHMTNGLPDVYNTAYLACGIRPDSNINLDEFWKYLTACEWEYFKPGERWSYGNTGYFLLGETVRILTNTSLSQYADERIFKPLGMNHTFIRDDRTKIIKNRAAGYSNYDSVHFNDSHGRYCTRHDKLSINEENVDVGGAGQLWTTVKDFFLWDRNFYHNVLGKGSDELIQLLTTSGLLENGEKCGYGWGLFLDDFCGHKLVNHGGWAGGYSAYFAQLPEKKLSVIVMGNHTDFFYDLEIDNEAGLTHLILKGLIGETGVKEENKVIETEFFQEKLDLDLSGRYMDPSNCWIWNIRKENGFYYIEDCFRKVTKIIYHGNDIFQSADRKQNYTVIHNGMHVPESIRLEDGNSVRTFYPFSRDKVDISDLMEYEGRYYCLKLGVSYYVRTDREKLFISNENRQNNAADLYYSPAIKDTFICEPNKFISNYCVTFSRDSNHEIESFSYRDNQTSPRDNFMFVKMR